MQISFEVTVKCVHRCITDPHIAEHNKDIKCKTCLMGTFIAALASQTCQDLGNFQIILDPLCLFVQEGIFNCAMWGLLNKLQLCVLSDWYYILRWIKTWFEAKAWRKFILFWRSQPWPWLHIPPCAVPSFLILANVCHILQGSRYATTNNGRNLLIPSMSCSLWAWKLNIVTFIFQLTLLFLGKNWDFWLNNYMLPERDQLGELCTWNTGRLVRQYWCLLSSISTVK